MTMSSSAVSPPQTALVNCTAWPSLEPDSDVTGIGVSIVSIRSSQDRLPWKSIYIRLRAPTDQRLIPPFG